MFTGVKFNSVTKAGIGIMLFGLLIGIVGIFVGIAGLLDNNSNALNNFMNMSLLIMWMFYAIGAIVTLSGAIWPLLRNMK